MHVFRHVFLARGCDELEMRDARCEMQELDARLSLAILLQFFTHPMFIYVNAIYFYVLELLSFYIYSAFM